MGRNPKKDVLKLNYRKGGRSVSEVWKKIKKEYIAGGTSYRKLAEKYGVSRTTLERKAKNEKWSVLKLQAEGKAEAKMVDAISTKNAEMEGIYSRLVDKVFLKAEEYIDSTSVWQVGMLKEMAITLKYLKECKGIKSEADINEQDARIEALRARAAASKANEEDEENEGGVIMLSTVDEAPKEAEGNE
jgi:cell division protein FtsL